MQLIDNHVRRRDRSTAVSLGGSPHCPSCDSVKCGVPARLGWTAGTSRISDIDGRLPGRGTRANVRVMRRLFMLILCISLPALGAHAASFDCAKAATAVEKMICGDPVLSQADEDLAKAYLQAMAVTLAPRGLRGEQLRWLTERNAAKTIDDLRDSYRRRIALLSEQARQWQSVRREVSEQAARQSCIVPPDPPDGTCSVEEFASVAGSNDGLAFQLQNYQTPQYRAGGGVVIFRRQGTMLLPIVLSAILDARFGTPRIIQSPAGKLLDVPGSMDGTGAFNAGSLYALEGDKPEEIDIESWLDDLAKRLPKGWGAWKGIFPDYRTLSASTPLWKSGDGNCCPTAGRATIKLGIRDRRLVIVDLHIRHGEAAAQGN